MKNLDEKITRRQAMQEQVVGMLRSTTNKVCKTMLAITGTGTISQARQELNDGIRAVRGLIRQLENDPTDTQVADDIRTSGCVVLNSDGKYIVDAECIKATFGESSDHYMLANQPEPVCFPYDDFPYPDENADGDPFGPTDLETYWDEHPVTISIDLDTGLRNVLIAANGEAQPEDITQLRDEILSNVNPTSALGEQVIGSKRPGPRVLPEILTILVRDVGHTGAQVAEAFGDGIGTHTPTVIGD